MKHKEFDRQTARCSQKAHLIPPLRVQLCHSVHTAETTVSEQGSQ